MLGPLSHLPGSSFAPATRLPPEIGEIAWRLHLHQTGLIQETTPGASRLLYGATVKKKWAINSAFMSMYAFASVLVAWVLFAYNMSFGPQWFPFLLATSAAFTTGQATIPAAAAGMPALTFVSDFVKNENGLSEDLVSFGDYSRRPTRLS